MARARNLRPYQETAKLKKWPGGRHAQLRLFLGHLESAFRESLAAQVVQSSKRKFSEFVPKIVAQDIFSEVEYREARVFWGPPKGLRNFLFYELQISLTENFANFDGFITYDPFFVFPNLLDGRTYYIRVRVVTKDGLFGPWSDNIEAFTPFSQAFGLFDGREFSASAFPSTNFIPIFKRPYTAIGGRIYYSINYEAEVHVIQTGGAATGGALSNPWGDVELQWVIDGDQVGQNFLVSTYGTGPIRGGKDALDVISPDAGTSETDSLFWSAPLGQLKRRGTFSQKFHEITAGDHEIELRARAINPHPTPGGWIVTNNGSNGGINYGQPVLLRFKNFTIFETLVS